MMPDKRVRAAGLRLSLTGILCALALFLGTGAALGRYLEKQGKDIAFQALQSQTLFLWNGAVNGENGLQPLSEWTETGEGSAVLKFQITNGTAGSYCGDTLRFCVRVSASLGIQDPDSMTVTLLIDGKEYTAKPVEIRKGSARYETFGPGWVYCFYDAGGAEVSWELAGGSLSAKDAVLTVAGSGEYVSLVRVEVTASQGT